MHKKVRSSEKIQKPNVKEDGNENVGTISFGGRDIVESYSGK
jgi:hypothetical protein